MRFVLTLLAVFLPFMTACNKKGGGGDAVAKLTELKDKMCACKDKACGDQVTADLAKWSSEQKGGETGKLDEGTQKKMAAISEDLGTCMTKLATDAMASANAAAAGSGMAAGSAMAAGSGMAAGQDQGQAAGSGDNAGSAAMGSGAGPGADMAAADGMAHRAGMCPSTVLGATTKSAMKGKTVVVTIEATDKDAIAAIQKRADELLAEKKDAPTGTGHDMKGTHGGGQGLCPVHVPEGAKATAKHEAKGVVVTITPKDKPDELAKDIAERVTKTESWVKTNVKPGDDKNQGGVGGGKGEDGSNHSGKGDGKGHERKKGGGGGKGTGGGGGAGTGTGSSKSG
jgi:hypothetical protein